MQSESNCSSQSECIWNEQTDETEESIPYFSTNCIVNPMLARYGLAQGILDMSEADIRHRQKPLHDQCAKEGNRGNCGEGGYSFIHTGACCLGNHRTQKCYSSQQGR